ncbi:thiamine diphosphokinase [Emticicia sp. TH156]|uniref:thiamine diphosphokinase n=1 Tax=Emticicia sp. TH156 TaxID=2067454 RepID=UPI000C784BD9|nr:thiamine diphosphokinase [Emticicia sp. TH156]PLK45954.1 thiamine diphosphokinase [Emticicia sp. TH156]
MSSHHIVREKQEPALIIANGEACSFELLGQLLEWSPFVVVLDQAIHRVLELGIKVDVLMGDFDKALDLEEIERIQYPIEIIHTPDQEKNDLDKAFEMLITRGFPAANVVWATGRRADHSITNMTNLVRYKSKLQIVMIDDYSVIYPLLPAPGVFEKWFSKGTAISLIPIGTAEGVRTENLLYKLDNEALVLGYRAGSSNEAAEDGLVRISYQSGDLLLMECRDYASFV